MTDRNRPWVMPTENVSSVLSLFVSSLYIYIRLRVHAETRNWHLLMEKPIVAHFFDKHPQCWYIFFYRATFLIPSGIISGWEPRIGSVSQYLGIKWSKILNKFWHESKVVHFFSMTLSSLPLLCVCVGKETPQPWPPPPILAPAVDQYWDSWDCHTPKYYTHTHPKVDEASDHTLFFLRLSGNVSQRKFEVHFRCESLQGFGGVLLSQGHTNT